MFEFLTQNKNGELVNLVDIINSDLQHLHASKLAFRKSVDMIAKAISKSEILVQSGSDSATINGNYYRLNIRPNDNETAYEFWYNVAVRLLEDQECLIVPIQDKLFVADSWNVDQNIIKPKKYTGISLDCAGDVMNINKSFKADEVIHIRYPMQEIAAYLRAILNQYDKLADAATSLYQLSRSPKFIFKLNAPGTMKLKDSKTGEMIAIDRFAEMLLDAIKEDKMSMLRLSEGMDLTQLVINSNVSQAEIKDIVSASNKAAANAFNIPLSCYEGTITEKSDATNEFITYAVSPLVKVINDALNAWMVGEDDYIRGQRITMWLGNFAHKDLIDAAAGLEKLRGIGFNFDEIRQAVGYNALNTEFSRARALTKNFTTDEAETGGSSNE